MSATTISRRARAERSAGFEQLRAQGLELVRQTSGLTWTDHNLHDPGITILEQLCFALTELVYRAGFEVADHLTGPDGTIDFAGLSLHPPQRVFPCRATTAADYRALLLDRVAGLDDAALLTHDPDAEPGRRRLDNGVGRLMVRLATAERQRPDPRAQKALAVYRAHRGLGEDVEPDVVVLADRWCELHAEIEIGGARDAVEVLAEVFHRTARHIDQVDRLYSRREGLDQGLQLEQLYEGPATQYGFRAADAAPAPHMLYLADLVRDLMGVNGESGVEGLKAVQRFELQTPDGVRESRSLVWRDATQMLRLRIPGAPGPAQGGPPTLEPALRVRRRNLPVEVSAQALWHRVQDLQAADRAQRLRRRGATRAEEADGLPRGAYRAQPAYHSVQHHFPALYQLGRHAPPASAPVPLRAAGRQLRAYLLLFEQIVANGQAQLHNLRHLFGQPGARHQTYWWQPLGADSVPGLEGLCQLTPDALEREVFAPLDYSAARKSALLDHLLALHGETFTQNALRQFCGHLGADELDAHLLANKAAYLKDIVSLSRDRAGGFDYSKPLWDDARNASRPARARASQAGPGDDPLDEGPNASGLARRACLLLGFRYSHARALTCNLVKLGQLLRETGPDDEAAPDEAELQASEALVIGKAPPQRAEREALLQNLLRRPRVALSAALARCGTSAEHYRLLPARAVPGASKPQHSLAVGPDEQQRWWRLGAFDTPGAARAAANTLRGYLLRVSDESEGLHLVEHVLLRPLQADAAPHAALGLRPPWFTLRLTAVLPDWTVRTRQAGFQTLAEETLRINCPPHLSLHVCWLGFDDMVRFEGAYKNWLDARLEHCKTPSQAQAREVDAAALAVIHWLLPSTSAPVPDFPTMARDDG